MRARMPRHRRRTFIAGAIGLIAVLVPAIALAHIERASYWPDPAADTSVNPPAGGSVPEIRDLYSALKGNGNGSGNGNAKSGTTRIVCQPDSLQRLDADLAKAQTTGYKIRPSQPAITLTGKEAKTLRHFNEKLFTRCTYDSIQAAVTDSHNNDRIEVMPGLYTEPASRAKPTNDPACDQYKITNDKNQTGAVSYAYQFHCPNDQNLIAVLGRALTDIPVPQPPLLDRHNIPDAGPCIRCNLQIQGTGASPDAVTVDAGNPASGDGTPLGSVKDVGIRADRADGFVLVNVKVRHALEHDVYIPETDGSHLDRLKVPYAGEYGVLTFVADHSLIENCDAWGSGDSGLYPGASADLGEAVPPAQRRYGTEIRDCDMHHNLLGFSGTDGNATWIHDNEFYDNTMGYSTDVFTAPGHPGFPQDSNLLERNDFYSNNFNSYLPLCQGSQKPGPRRVQTRAVRTSPRPSRFRSGRGCGSPAGTQTSFATTASGTTGAAGRWCSRCRIPSSATTRITRWPAVIRPRPFRPLPTATGSTTTAWGSLPMAAVSATASTSGGTRAASQSIPPSTPPTAGTGTPVRTARRAASPVSRHRARRRRTTCRPTATTARPWAPKMGRSPSF